MTKVLLLALCGGVLGIAGVRVMDALGVLIVHTPSIAEGVYLRKVASAPGSLQRGQVVCLDATSAFAPLALREGLASGRFPAYWRTQPIVKHVGALSGDQLAYSPEVGLSVNGQALRNSVRKAFDLDGKPLPSPAVPSTLPAGYVWLASTHPDGFDSRYMGPVDQRALSCVAEALWTF